jgi:hypothetical protein
MKFISFILMWFAILGADKAFAINEKIMSNPACGANAPVIKGRVVSTMCNEGMIYKIIYDKKKKQILSVGGTYKTILHKIPSGYDPALVGADVFIGFLPEVLQIYKKNNLLLYISTIRTNGGAGGGQCGSGSEIFLNFLDVGGAIPKTRSQILIGSCEESIELADQDMSAGILGDIFVSQNRIALHFMNYKNLDGSPTAVLSSDFKQLSFER